MCVGWCRAQYNSGYLRDVGAGEKQMNCCSANGRCDQGKDCPIRKQRIKGVLDADAKGYDDGYNDGYNDARMDDPFEDIVYTVKGLIIVIAVVSGLTLLAFALWGK